MVKKVPLPPREFLLPVLYEFAVGEDGVLTTVFGLNSSASGFSLNVLRDLNKECMINMKY